MPGFDQWFPMSSGAGALPVWLAGGLAALAVCAGVVAFARAAQAGRTGLVWRATLMVAAAGCTWLITLASSGRDQTASGRILEARAHDLTMRTLAPGSPLGCLEAVANPRVEEACEKALFGSVQSVAAAVAYVDARLSLLADGIALSASDSRVSDTVERWRRSIESDRFGLVAHVLRTRGCSADRCDELKLLQNPQRVLDNLRERNFEAQIVLHSKAWATDDRPRPAPAAPALSSAPAAVPDSPPAVAEAPAATTTGTSGPIDYPTAASIPAISIMNAEPPLSPAEAQALAGPPPTPKPAAPAPAPQQAQQQSQPRRQPARDHAPPVPPPGTQQPQQQPVQIAPPPASNIPRWGGGN